MGFYKTAILSFAVQLLILLAVVAYFVANHSKSQEFPATVSECPDYYTMDSNGKCIMDISVYDNSTSSCRTIDTGVMKAKEKQQWAASCGVAWDGITNVSII